MNEIYFLNKIYQLIEKRNQLWGPVSQWTEYHFKLLSESISQVSEITISISTLKRMLGKRKSHENYNPQADTKKALAIYLGFKDWETFKQSSVEDAIEDSISETLDSTPSLKSRLLWNKGFSFFAGLILIVIAAFVIGAIFKWRSSLTPEYSFKVTNTNGNFPLNCKVNYDITKIKDSVFISFGDNFWTYLSPDKKFISRPFDDPGVFKVKIYTKSKALDSAMVQVMSNGWIRGLAIEREEFRRIVEPGMKDDGTTSFVTLEDIKAIDAYRTRYWIKYLNIRDFAAEGDNFSFEVDARNNHENGGLPYYDVILKVFCENSKIEVFFIGKGQFYWVINQFSEIYLNGEYNDLSAFNRDLSDWRKIKLEVKDKNVDIFFENRRIFNLRYQKPLGPIKGIGMGFRGFGNFRNLILRNQDQEIVYQGDWQ